MKTKYGKWYADWRDAQGIRHAKTFTTKKAAAIYQAKQQKAAQQGKVQRSQRSAKSPARGTKPSARARRG
jgi:hypothetical protein